MKMQGDSIISALIGLVGAVSNNGKTEQTDSVIREAFLCLKDADSEEEMVQKIHAEKFIIAPDCATCLNPCGNTSDYDMAQFYAADRSYRCSRCHYPCKKCYGICTGIPAAGFIYYELSFKGSCGRYYHGRYFYCTHLLRLLR